MDNVMFDAPTHKDIHSNLKARAHLEWLDSMESDVGRLEAEYRKMEEKLKTLNNQAERMMLQEEWWMEEGDPQFMNIADVPIMQSDLIPQGEAYMVDTSAMSLDGSNPKRPILMMPKGAMQKIVLPVPLKDAWWKDEHDPGISEGMM